MAKLRVVALWSAGVVTAALVTLSLTGALGPIYRWMVRYLPPDVWEAIGTWVTAAVAIVAAVFAWSQVKVARETREEQAQPNVVLYSEPTANDWHILEIVIQNFGTTPAYDIKISITPPLEATPNFTTDGKLAKVRIASRIPILAPGQSWRTIWDVATERVEHLRELNRKLGQAQILLVDYYDLIPASRHTAKVTYTDSKRVKKYETDAELDFKLLDGTIRAEVYTVDDLTKRVESLRDNVKKIGDALGNFSKEHRGVWVYPSDAETERQFQETKHQRLRDELARRQQRYHPQANPPAAAAAEPTTDPATESQPPPTPSETASASQRWRDRVRELFGR